MAFRGFCVIVPPEYRRLGCLPPEQFVLQLMEHHGLHQGFICRLHTTMVMSSSCG